MGYLQFFFMAAFASVDPSSSAVLKSRQASYLLFIASFTKAR
jgi:hypothetical protein